MANDVHKIKLLVLWDNPSKKVLSEPNTNEFITTASLRGDKPNSFILPFMNSV